MTVEGYTNYATQALAQAAVQRRLGDGYKSWLEHSKRAEPWPWIVLWETQPCPCSACNEEEQP